MSSIDRRALLTAGGALAAVIGTRASGGAAAPPAAAGPTLTPAFSARITVGKPIELGTVNGVRKRIIPIAGGSFSGERISGTVLPGGADWQFVRPDGVADLTARYTIQASDGTPISVSNSGLRRGPPEVMRRIAEGQDVDPALYYFRASARFEVGPGPHQWLADSIFLCTGGRHRDHVELHFFEVG